MLQRQPSTAPALEAQPHAPGIVLPPRRRWIGPAVAAVIAIVAAGAAYAAFLRPASSGTLRVTGVIAANEVTIAARTAGRIRQLAVAEGDTVAADGVVAVLDRDDLEAARLQQVAVIAELEARLARSGDIVALESSRSDGQIARARAELSAARSRARQADAELDDLREEAGRVGKLVDLQLVARRELDRLRAQVAVAEARQAAARDSVAAAAAAASVAEAEAGQVGVAERDVEQIRAQLQQAEAQLAQIDVRVDEAVVVSPIDGVVSLRVARQGEVVNAGDPIAVLVDPDDVWISAAVEESAVSDVAVGDTVPVELLSGARRTGRVTFIAPEAAFATQRDVSRARRDIRTFSIKVALANEDRRLHPGMTAFVLLPQGVRTAR
jgi:multidrug resistance efflux pump